LNNLKKERDQLLEDDEEIKDYYIKYYLDLLNLTNNNSTKLHENFENSSHNITQYDNKVNLTSTQNSTILKSDRNDTELTDIIDKYSFDKLDQQLQIFNDAFRDKKLNSSSIKNIDFNEIDLNIKKTLNTSSQVSSN
jgi:hypothetical protein